MSSSSRSQVLRRTLQLCIFSLLLLLLLQWRFDTELPSLGLSTYTSPSLGGEKVAYATLLLPSSNTTLSHENDWVEEDDDVYFLSARMLAYRLLHSSSTCTRLAIPFLVLVTEDIESWKTEVLAREGATIITVKRVPQPVWVQPLASRWEEVMVKLRLWELVQYNRILFLDADTLVLKNMDGIFSDPAGKRQKTLEVEARPEHEGKLPKTYVFGSRQEVLHTNHEIPPIKWPYFNAGFFMLSPSATLFNYYTSLLETEGKFDTAYPEQNLLNYAHRERGNMPWRELSWKWNVNLPTMRDVRAGVRSLHVKGWDEGNILQPVEAGIGERWREVRAEMEGSWKRRGVRR